MSYQEKRTSAAIYNVSGIAFECWQVGIMQTEWRSADGRAVVRVNPKTLGSYSATVDGVTIGRRFHNSRTAMNAAGDALTKPFGGT